MEITFTMKLQQNHFYVTVVRKFYKTHTTVMDLTGLMKYSHLMETFLYAFLAQTIQVRYFLHDS